MTPQIPRTMRAIALTKYCKPTEYQLATLPVPTISKPDELLIKVKAAAVNPIDVKMASELVSPPSMSYVKVANETSIASGNYWGLISTSAKEK